MCLLKMWEGCGKFSRIQFSLVFQSIRIRLLPVFDVSLNVFVQLCASLDVKTSAHLNRLGFRRPSAAKTLAGSSDGDQSGRINSSFELTAKIISPPAKIYIFCGKYNAIKYLYDIYMNIQNQLAIQRKRLVNDISEFK